MLLHVDDLAELIERVMRDKDWTLSTLSRRTGIATSTLSSWKTGDRARGSRGPSPEKLRRLAEGAGIPVSEVFEAAGRHVPAAMNDADERRFLHLLRSLDRADRKVIEATMQAMSDRQRS